MAHAMPYGIWRDGWDCMGRLGIRGTGGKSWAPWDFMACLPKFTPCSCESQCAETLKCEVFAFPDAVEGERKGNLIEVYCQADGIAGKYGKKISPATCVYIWCVAAVSPLIVLILPSFGHESQADLWNLCQGFDCVSQKTVACPSIPIVSLLHRMRRGTGHQTTPSQTKRAGFIQAFAFIEQRDPARGRADIPPGGARSRTSRKAGQGGGLISGSRSARPFTFWGTV